VFAEPGPDRLVGIVLGGAYRLVGRIGAGGMGVVYEAHHLRLHKRVAVKLVNRANANKPDALDRFHREALLASRLGHPHLVTVIDFGTSDEGQPFLVMEFLEGEDLDHRMQRMGPMPLQSVIHIARQTASAVAAVHAKGIVHRDLKPANIFLVHMPGEPDFVKVLDFGMSKIRAAPSDVTDGLKRVGTPHYMSPEQVVGAQGEVDQGTDQWALACIVWEMLAGRLPFSVEDRDELFYQLINLPPPPLATYAFEVPPAVEAVLLRAMSKRPVDRYPSIRDFARGLEAAVEGTCVRILPIDNDPTVIDSSMADPNVRDTYLLGALSESMPESFPAPFPAGTPDAPSPNVVPSPPGRKSLREHPRGRASWAGTWLGTVVVIIAFTFAGALGGLYFADGKTVIEPERPAPRRAEHGIVIEPDPPPTPAAPSGGSQGRPEIAVIPSPIPGTTEQKVEVKNSKPTVRRYLGKHKRPKGRLRATASARMGKRRTQRLTIDDF